VRIVKELGAGEQKMPEKTFAEEVHVFAKGFVSIIRMRLTGVDGLYELARLRRFCEAVEICGKFKSRSRRKNRKGIAAARELARAVYDCPPA